MRKIFQLFTFLFLYFTGIHAQKLNVESLIIKTNDITARTQPRQDINGNDCALVKVQLAAPNASFGGNVIGDVAYDTSEYFVYMSNGSKRMTIKLEGYLPLDVNFEDYNIKSLEAKTVYVMTVSGVSTAKPIEPARTKTGWIVINSDPSGATVYINDEFVGNTPITNYKQAYGTYTYRLEHPNYHSSTGTIELNSGKTEKTVGLKPAFGAIAITSSVTGAKVLLDGKATNKVTPCTLEEIPSGQHTIIVQKDKYSPRQQIVVVEDGQTAKISVTLDARFAQISINSLDGAQIYCNGELKGSTKYMGDLMEGYYDVEARLAHHKSITKQIQVFAGQSQEITLNPIPKYGSLDIMSEPYNATIMIDGKVVGKSPLTVNEILEGEHMVQVTLDNYQPETKKITIIEKQTGSLQFSLNNFTPQYYFDLGMKSEKSKDFSQAAKWFRKGAEQGHSRAQTYLAYLYEHGLGLTKDLQEAIKWYKLAAQQGYAAAQFNLGTCYQRGNGVSINYDEALKWYTLAANQGLRDAQQQLGFMYYKGLGVTENYYEAVKWFTKAAEQGLCEAQESLGHCYENGLGVTMSYEQALKWYNLAAEQGDQDAINAINGIKAKMR